tara:strand:+ start:22053 stop:23303 length:1251 start_codon:yes stop_codon:yes gene_type:complete
VSIDDSQTTDRGSWTRGELQALDVSSPERFQRNEHPALFRALRRDYPVHYCPESPYGPYWSVSRYEDVLAVERDHAVYSSENNIIIGDVPAEFDVTRAFATSDPPRHTQERRAVLPAFTRKRLEALEEGVRDKIRTLLRRLPRNTSFDWVENVATVITNNMVGELFDLSVADREQLPFWCEALVTTPAPGAIVETWQERQAVVETFRDRLLSLWTERRQDHSRCDVVTALTQNRDTAHMDCDPLRLVGTVALIAGANEAARGALTGAIVAFDQFPQQRALLQNDPALIKSAVAEIVRWQTPIIHMRRTTTQETTLRTCVIPKGSKVVMWYCSANRDESVFEDADKLDISRSNSDKHLGYGSGIHRCLGQHVAEMELRVLLEELLASNLRIEMVSPPERFFSNFSSNYARLMVRVHQ